MKKIKNANFFWLLPILCLLVLPSCLEKEEGCRDVNATNFAADAERDCENCCTYPNITFEIDHAVQQTDIDTFLRYGDTIMFEDKILYFLETSFYINGVSLNGTDQTIVISDQITLTDRAENTNLITDDIAIISRDINSFSYDIGSFSGQGNYEELNFQLGLTPVQAATDPSTIATTHPLSSSNGLFSLPDSNYVFTRLRLVNVVNDDTLQYDLTTPVNITLPYEVTVNRGFDVDIPIKVNYLKWIEGINFADNPNTTNAIIVGNLANAFSIDE